jgi:SAM-dependent methyltransferase
MIAGLFRRVLAAGARGGLPRTRRLMWRASYDLMSSVWRDPAWHFMNYGYLPPDGPPPAEPDAVFVNLYRTAIGDLPLQGARLLEVGSGRGGGAAWLAARPGVVSVTGVDLSPRTVARARRLHGPRPGLDFRQGDAEALPFPDASFDGVVNIESSHCYGSMPRFLGEVVRVLRPGGWFAWADMRDAGQRAAHEAAFAASGLETVEEQDLTEGVLRALAAAEVRKAGAIARFRPVAGLMREFAGMEGSMLRRALERRSVVYLARRCRRPFS